MVGRKIFICPDNAWDREELKKAVYALGRQLVENGAVVYIVDLPKDEKKIGLDDYLLDHTAEDFWKLPTKKVPVKKAGKENSAPAKPSAITSSARNSNTANTASSTKPIN